MVDEAAAREALKALGITPNRDLIKNWTRAAIAEQRLQREAAVTQTPPPTTPMPTAPPVPASAQPEIQDFRPKHKHPRGYSKSNLEQVLSKQGTLEKPQGIRKPGRPRVIARWFPEVAKEMAEGTPLKEALRRHGITLDKAQIRAVYRSEEFKRLCREERGRRQ